MKTFNKAFYFPLLFLSTIIFPVSGSADLIEAFVKVNPASTYNVQGNYAIAGNTVMCLTALTDDYAGDGDICHGMTDYENITSNNRVSKYLDIDSDNDTWNSTSSYITLPSTFDADPSRGILWAGLFWQGRISDDDDHEMHYGEVNASGSGYHFVETGDGSPYTLGADLSGTDADHISLKVNNGSYSTVTSESFHEFDSSGGITYAAYAEVTNIVKTAISTDGNHTFTVANLTTNEGRENSPGVFGGWSLVVIYAEDGLGEMRNITVLSGFDSVGNDDTFTIDDFILPKSGVVNSTLSLFAGEGETLYDPDWIWMSDDGTNYDDIPDPNNEFDDNNIFDGVFTGVTRAKLYEADGTTDKFNDLQLNNDGVDVDTFDVSTLMTTYRDANPDLHSMNIRWDSDSDYITPSMLVFATQIYAPKLCYDYSVKQDGRYLDLDRNSSFPRITSYISSSDIEVSVYLRNEEADIAADGVSIKSDVNTTNFNVDGSEPLYSSNVNGSILLPRLPNPNYSASCDYNTSFDNETTNVGCTDNHNIRKGLGSLDALDYIYTKFTLQPNVSGITDINESLGLTLDYHITVDTTSITYNDYELGSINVPICQQSHSYEPTWGQFNVVRDGQTSANNTNNIYTQISRNPFNASVIFDSDTATGTNEAPLSDVNTTVLVEIIDVGAYGDINASCANPDASLSTPIFVPTNFNSSNWMTDLTLQTNSYYNFAVENAAYRVWYFADSNGTLIENWTATTIAGTNNQGLSSISGLYNSTAHTVCSSACTDDTSTDCFYCIQANYAQPLCSRDNFSVRPESYDVRIYDVDQNNSVSDPSNIDLSTLEGFDPSSAATASRIDLAADYNYRYDINATGNDSTDRVPGYSRYFTDRTDYNVTMYWDPQSGQTGCNNTNNVLIPLHVPNGSRLLSIDDDGIRDHIQVGEYKLNVIDTSWTAVDWSDNGHQTAAKGFDEVDDCQNNSTSSTAVSGRYGCTISTDHGTVNGNSYQDHDVTYHPYKFNTTNTVTLGKGNISASATGFKPFVYMSNLSQDENMSVHLNTTVTAVGKNSTTPLSNYVTGCYSKPLNFSVGKTATTNTGLTYNYIVHNKDSNGTIISAHDIAQQTIAAGNVDQNATFATSNLFFQQDQNGTIQLTTNLNYGRDVNVTANPEDINFTIISLDDNTTLFNADLVANKFADGNVSVNQRVIHYYGKTIAPRIRVVCNTNICRTGTHSSNNNNISELISYVVFCEGGSCNSAILPVGATQVGDIRWFSNRNHDKIDDTGNWLTLGTDGTVGTISEVVNSTHMNEISRAINLQNYETEAVIEHGGALPLPYDAIMQMQSSPWLINHETDNNATTNQFIIQFVGDGGWSGKHEDNTTTKTNFSPTTNRRIMW